MIPHDYITEWRAEAPWVADSQVEQDLVISRALVEIFSHPALKDALAFRGGTALYRLHLKPAARYSEDIDLVRTEAGPAGPIMDALREVLDPWLGGPRWKQTEGRVTFAYRFDSEDRPPIPLRLKVEINTREHFAVYLFDLATALESPDVKPERIIESFSAYMEHEGRRVTRAQFEENLSGKLTDRQFTGDVGPLLATGFEWDIEEAAPVVSSRLITLLPGDPWKG